MYILFINIILLLPSIFPLLYLELHFDLFLLVASYFLLDLRLTTAYLSCSLLYFFTLCGNSSSGEQMPFSGSIAPIHLSFLVIYRLSHLSVSMTFLL